MAPDEKLIEVVMKVESEIEPEKLREEAVAQLKSVGITGLMFIELERKAPGDPDLSQTFDFEPPYTVIATRPSEISKFFKGVEDVFNLFRAIDTETISMQLTAALAKINRSIDDAQVDELIADVRTTVQSVQKLLDQNEVQALLRSANQAADNMNRLTLNADEGISEMRQTVAGLDRIILKGGDDVAAITADLRASSLEVKKAMETAAIMLESTDRQLNLLQRQVLITVNRIDQAGRSLNRILEQVANQPSQVIFGGAVPDKPTLP